MRLWLGLGLVAREHIMSMESPFRDGNNALCMCVWVKIHLPAIIFASLTISSEYSNSCSPNLLHPRCHSNVRAANWFPLACCLPYQADCQLGRWEALRGTLLFQQIPWIAQTALYRAGYTGEESIFVVVLFLKLCYPQDGLLDLEFNLHRLVFMPFHLLCTTDAILLC